MSGTVYSLFFSPTHTSRAVARTISTELEAQLHKPCKEWDWTLPQARGAVSTQTLCEDDVLIAALPVYAGRIPDFLQPLLQLLHGQNTPAIAVAVYGNRDYDDALLETCDLLAANGFSVQAAGAFIGEHSLSSKVAANRPDAQDLAAAKNFAAKAAQKLLSGAASPVIPEGHHPYKERGASAPVVPKTTSACNGCGLCAKNCPMGVIDEKEPQKTADGCIHCCACVKSCPQNAKHFTNPRLIAVKTFLETTCKARKEPEIFL